MMLVKLKNWYLRRQVRKAKSRVHRVCDSLYMLRTFRPDTAGGVDAILDDNLYPILPLLDELEESNLYLTDAS